jgi:lysozyme
MDITIAAGLALPLVFSAEGCRLDAYLDSLANPPVWTIGHGTRWIDGVAVEPGQICTQAEADTWATEALADAALQVLNAVRVPLTDHQLAALASFTYNIGISRFRRSTVLVALNARRFQSAADRLLDYDYAGGKPEPGLQLRRARERTMFLNGDSAPPAITPPAPTDETDALNQQELDQIEGTS